MIKDELQKIIAGALAEDIGAGDITSELLIPADTQAEMVFIAREEMVACGMFVVDEVYRQLDCSIRVTSQLEEGSVAKKGQIFAIALGNARALLAGERVALNLIQRMCGVATLTQAYVEAVKGTKAIILDTRKTMPGLRVLDKYAVRMGGGQNHRMRLDDMVLIKDNHIVLCGDLKQAIAKVKQSKLKVVVECDTLKQVIEVLDATPDRILLDNMTLGDLRGAVEIVAGRIPLEASGGVSLATVKAMAETGVDYISVGKITHSASAADIGADIKFKNQS